jgi:hypothetical protein
MHQQPGGCKQQAKCLHKLLCERPHIALALGCCLQCKLKQRSYKFLTRQHAALLGGLYEALAGLTVVELGQGYASTPGVVMSKLPQVGLSRGTQQTCGCSSSWKGYM